MKKQIIEKIQNQKPEWRNAYETVQEEWKKLHGAYRAKNLHKLIYSVTGERKKLEDLTHEQLWKIHDILEDVRITREKLIEKIDAVWQEYLMIDPDAGMNGEDELQKMLEKAGYTKKLKKMKVRELRDFLHFLLREKDEVQKVVDEAAMYAELYGTR